jgi:hypothetical protein
MSDYKFAFVLEEENNYLSQEDLTGNFSYLSDLENVKFKFDENGIVYIQEEVNRPKTDMVEEALKKNQVGVKVVSKALWNGFDKLN